MGGEYGIKATGDLVSLGASIGKAFDAAYEDGKLDMRDVALLVPVALKIPAAVGSAGEAFKEMGELDDEDLKALHEKTKGEFGEGYSEEIGEQALLVGLHLARLLSIIKAGKSAA